MQRQVPRGRELEAVGLTWQTFDTLHAPRVREAVVAYGLRLTEEHALANGTTLVVGAIEEVHLSPSVHVASRGLVQHPEDLLLAQGLDTYHHSKALVSLSYAQPDRQPSTL